MLHLSGALLNQPVLSLRTGTPVARVVSPIINPNNLKIEGFYVQDNRDKRQLVMLYQDIRDLIPQGFVINDHDVLAAPEELVRLHDIMELKFDLLGKPVFTASKDKIGKVSDYATETTTMFIQKLYVTQSLLKSLAGGNLGIDRNQIIEITPHKVVINDLLQATPAHVNAMA